MEIARGKTKKGRSAPSYALRPRGAAPFCMPQQLLFNEEAVYRGALRVLHRQFVIMRCCEELQFAVTDGAECSIVIIVSVDGVIYQRIGLDPFFGEADIDNIIRIRYLAQLQVRGFFVIAGSAVVLLCVDRRTVGVLCRPDVGGRLEEMDMNQSQIRVLRNGCFSQNKLVLELYGRRLLRC